MPTVGKGKKQKKFSYSKSGVKAAARYAKKTGQKMSCYTGKNSATTQAVYRVQPGSYTNWYCL